MWLLNWLLDRASRVIEFFDTLYGAIHNAALNAYRWAQEAASSALASARSYASGLYTQAVNVASSLFNQAVSTARSLFDQAKTLIVSYYNSAMSTAQGLANQVSSLVRLLFDQALANAAGLFDQAKAIATALFNQAIANAAGLVDQLKTIVLALVAKTEANAKGLIDQLGVIFQARLDKLLADFLQFKAEIGATTDAAKGTLLSFLANPLMFLAAYVASFLLTMLFDLLGHGLGSLKYDLPPPIVWGPGGSGGPYPPGPGPGPGALGLSKPLAHLRISGYVYGPGHPGTDFGLTMGEPVYAAHAGKVLQAGWNPVGYGFDVVLAGGDWWTRYGHLQQPVVGVGDQVGQAQVIGLGDTTGNSTGPHLHFEVKYRGSFVDPVTVLPLG